MYITLKREPVIGIAIGREKTTRATTVSLLFLCWIIKFEVRKQYTA
jgi:hypothetical protein